MEYVLSEFQRVHGKDVSENKKSRHRILMACEKAKCALSSSTQSIVEVPGCYEGTDLYVKITRAKFDDLCDGLFRQTIATVERVLKDSDLTKEDVHEIVLVGGSTRVLKVQNLLSEFFNNKPLNKSINPDEAVALGAAFHAAVLQKVDPEKLKGVILLDVCPLSLGIKIYGGIMSVIIERNTSIPAVMRKNFTTAYNNQTSVIINVYEGERKMVKDNTLLGTFEIKNIKKAPAKVANIEVTFKITEDGIMEVTAEDVNASDVENVETIILRNGKDRLSKEEITRHIENAQKYKDDDRIARERVVEKNSLESYLLALNKNVHETFSATLSEHEKNTLEVKLLEVSVWFDSNQDALASDFKAKHKEIELIAMPIMMSQRLAAGKRKFEDEDGGTVQSSPEREDENSEEEDGE
jgi:L1 cell adhesion molecule like protein